MINDEYNIKIVHYKNYDEVQFFRDSVVCRDDVLIDEDGVISHKVREPKKIYNPFTNEMEVMSDFDEQNHYIYLINVLKMLFINWLLIISLGIGFLLLHLIKKKLIGIIMMNVVRKCRNG